MSLRPLRTFLVLAVAHGLLLWTSVWLADTLKVGTFGVTSSQIGILRTWCGLLMAPVIVLVGQSYPQQLSWYVPIANIIAWALGLSVVWQITASSARRHVARSGIVIVLAITLGIYFFLENAIPFDEKRRDSLSVWGIVLAVLGFAGTWASLWYAYKQLRQTEESARSAQDAAELAKKAAEDATAYARWNFGHFTAQHAHHLIREVKIHVGKAEWVEVAYRLRDVTECAIASPRKTEPSIPIGLGSAKNFEAGTVRLTRRPLILNWRNHS